MIRVLRTFALLAALALPAQGTEAFVPGIDDLPLMPGLVADASTAVLYDKPSGRLVEITATGAMDPDSVRAYYVALMAPLGWTPEDSGGWVREGEWLRLEVAAVAGGTRIRFVLAPR